MCVCVCVLLCREILILGPCNEFTQNKLFLELTTLYIYIYTYVCICICTYI